MEKVHKINDKYITSLYKKHISGRQGKKKKRYDNNCHFKERKNLKPRGGPEEHNMMGIVLSYRRPSYTIFLKVEFSLLTSNMEQDRIGNMHG